jgi:hypothetical protein
MLPDRLYRLNEGELDLCGAFRFSTGEGDIERRSKLSSIGLRGSVLLFLPRCNA